MKLHLPVFLRKAILALMLAYGVPALHAANLTLGAADSLSVDYSTSGSLLDLNNGTLWLSGGTTLLLSSCGEGDGKTYILLTGVSFLLDAEGNALTLGATNNAASLYFDTTQPGSGFWAAGTLQLVNGQLQLMRRDKYSVQSPFSLTSRKTGHTNNYQYYHSFTARNLSVSSSSFACGGAIYGDSNSTITLSDNGSVLFEGNTASGDYAYGGAIYGESRITLSNNGSVVFEGNTASGSTAYGGAIDGDSRITLSNNGSVLFEGNTASGDYAYGGAICGRHRSSITLSNNGSVVFEGNSASGSSFAYGGAIYGDEGRSITLSNNGSVKFSGNTASGSTAYGGAIYGDASSTITLSNNGSVVFEKNAEVRNGTYRLRSIYAGGSSDVISLSAAAGKSIEFRDSVYIDSGTTVNLNADYGEVRQQGDIVFTGKYAEQHLNELLEAAGAGRTATAEEILNSCTTEVLALTNLYGGCLRVEDGAVYKGRGITAHEGSAASVRVQNAELSHIGYELTFNVGTTLELVGSNIISCNVQMQEGSTLMLNTQESMGTTDLVGDLNLADGVTLALSDGSTWSCENGILMCVFGNISGGNADRQIVTNTGTYGVYDLTWVDNFLVLNYNAETFNKYLNGTVVYSSRLEDCFVEKRRYESISFENISSSSFGGAIVGSVTMVFNGDIAFKGNSACSIGYYYSASGGAIYGDENSTITLNHNESVVFEGNSVGSNYAYGGAIYGYFGSTVMLNNNGSVVFEGNSASSSSSDVCGGAIFGYGDITLSNNGSVVFKGNSVRSTSYIAYGGAIFRGVTMEGNGDIVFSGNTASGSTAYGGAIYGAVTMEGNGDIVFSGNTASGSTAYGGAIYASGDLSIRNNDSVLFEKNVKKSGSTYRLRSIYAGGSGDAISLSAAAGKTIEFRDSVYISSGSTVLLNADYGEVKQQGDIVFTGKYAEQHLNELLEAAGTGRTATAQEILNSRTSEVYALTNLYGGRLRVEDGAVYKGCGITVREGSGATVRVQNATLSHGGYALTFNAGTTLELAGNNTISGNVQMLEGSTLRFISSAGGELTTHTGSLNVAGAVVVELQRGQKFEQGEIHLGLFQTNDSDRTWNPTSVRVIAPADYGEGVVGEGVVFAMGDVEWVDNVFGIRCYVSDTVHWNNAAGDGLWNNSSANWVSGGYSFARIQGTHVILGATGQGEITLVGDIALRSLTVENGCSYELDFATDASLVVQKELVLEHGATLSLHGNLDAAAVKAQGALVVDGNVDMNGALYLGSGSAITGHVSGATDATLSNATITGALEASGEVSADGGSIGSITGTATKVELTDMDSIGSITMATTGDLVVSGTETGAVNAANGNKVANATLTNATIGFSLNVTYNMTTTGDVTVAGDVTVGKDLAVNTGTLSADNVTVAGTTTLTNGKVAVEGTFHSTTVILNNINGEMTELKTDKGLSLSGSDLDVTITGTGAEAVKVAAGGMSLAAGATVTNKGGASIAGGLTVDDATFTDKGGVAVTGKTEVTNGGELTGASLTTDGLTADDAVVSIDGDLNLTEDGLIVTNDAEVTAKGITNAGAVVVKDGGKLTADSVSGATSAELTDAIIKGALEMTGTDADVTADGVSIGSITGADDVTLKDQAEVKGCITMSGALEMTNATAASVSGADSATLSNATIAGELAAGATEVLKDSTVGSATVGALKVATGVSLTADGAVTVTGAVDAAGSLTVEGTLTAASLQTFSLEAAGLTLTDSSTASQVTGAVQVSGQVQTAADLTVGGAMSAQQVRVDGALTAASLQASSLEAAGLTLTDSSAASQVTGAVQVSRLVQTAADLVVGGAMSAQQVRVDGALTAASLQTDALEAGSLKLTDAAASSRIGSSVAMTGAVDAAGTLVVEGSLKAASLLAKSLEAASLTLTDANAGNRIGGAATLAGAVNVAGALSVEGMLTAASLKAASLEVGSLVLTAENAVNTVTGNLTADSVSLVAGSSLTIDGVLTANEVQMSGTALTLTAGSFGAAAMNFELDRAALESLGLAHGATAVIARTTASLTEEVAVMLNGTTDFVQAAAYEYKISAVGNTVQVLADYAHEGMKVWYRGAWVGDSSWADYHIAGYDAVDGVENVNLCNRSYSGDMLIVALEQGVHSAVITGAELEFANVDLGGGELVLGAGTTLTSTEIYGPGETLSVLENAALHADAVQLGVLHLEYTDVSLKDASIGAITGTTGKLTIARNGKVTVNSDVELGSFLNDGYLNVGSHNLTVNALTDKGGNVTAGEVSVQCRASRMAEFDMLIADRVTVTNNVAGARYSDDIVLGDGSVVGELLADKLVVKGGTVTLGSTTAETVQNVHALELQNGATLILNQTFVELGEDFVASDGSSIQLEEGGNVLRGDLGVSSLEEALVLDATILTGDELPSTLSNARMTAYGDDAARYDGLLLDSAVVNEGSGTFSVNNSGNALVEIEACRGDVLVYNVPIHALRKLDIADGKTVSAYSAGTAHAAYEASVVLNGTARIGRSARLNANLVVKSGSSLNLAGSLTMGSSLELESGLTLGGVVFSSLQSAQSGAVIGLFNGVDELTLAGQKYNAISLRDGVLASVVFSNLENNGAHEYYFVYDSATQGEGELGICYNYNDNYVTPDEPEIPDTPVTPDEPEIPDTPETPDEPEIPDAPVTPDEPEIPDTPVTPDEPEKSEPLNPLRPGAKPVLVGGDIDKNTEVILTEKGNVTLEGKVNAGAITVNSDKNITFKSNKKKPGSLTGDGDLTKKGKGTLTLNDGNGTWTGEIYLEAGTIKVKGTTSLGKGDVYVQGGTLNLGSKAIANDIIQSKNATIKSGKKFTGTYTLEGGELQKGSTLNISKTATLESGTVNGTLSGNGKTEVTGKVTLGDKGKITTRALTLGEDATLTTSAKGLSSKTTTLSIGEDATLSLGGKMTVDSLKMNGCTLKTTASKPAAMTVKNNMELTDAVLSTNGKVTTNKLTLNNSTMGIKGAKAQNLTVKQALTIGSGSALTLNGKLSAGSLTIQKDGMLTMSGSKPVTLKVKGALTLNEGSSIILNYSFVQGKTYKMLTFSSYSGSKDYYSIFGVEADDCTITNTGKALTLTVNTKWKPQPQQKAVSAGAAEPVVATKSQANPVADALVQANWGQLEASRAFVNAIANRSMAVQLGNGERAVWASAIGSSSRHSSAGGHNGADTNVSGGAFGLETQVGRASLFGMALGNSWTRVSAHGFGTIEQDTTHLGLYGQTNWRSGVTADWSAAYGRSESESMGCEWNQKQLQLDGRVSYNHELNARTVLSPFAGVQYYASDSAAIGTTDTGSLQNLRAEIGVAASHRVGKFGVYGEIALHQDMARNNPTVSMEGMRYNGMNPGRTGINFTIGASYELNDKWSVNASYTGEFVENANAHSANVGASYKF